MDLQDDFSFIFEDSEDNITIDGIDCDGFFCRPDPVLEPFHGDGAEAATFILVQRDDLEALGQWPVDAPVVVVDELTYRVVRDHENGGHVLLYVEEA